MSRATGFAGSDALHGGTVERHGGQTTDERQVTERQRAKARSEFIAACGWQDAMVVALPGDASFRRYCRLVRTGAERAILMDAPPPHEQVVPFARVARHLRALGLSAPQVLAECSAAGFLLLEDLGEDTFTRLLARGAAERPLYRLAVDTLVHLQRHPMAADIDVPAYDIGRLLNEAALFVDWYLPALLGRATAAGLREDYLALWTELLAPVSGDPRTLVLRDYHVDNLMRLEQRAGVRACGLLDFQDAVIGHPAYDLMSLLEDARRDVPATVVQSCVERFLDARPDLGREGFASAFALLAAQRHCKVAGIFVRLWLRDGKPAYLDHLPRVLRLLEAKLAEPVLQPLRRWMDRHARGRTGALGRPDPVRLASLVHPPMTRPAEG